MADRTPQLLDQFGQPIERQALTQEIAGPTITGVRSSLTGYPGDGLNPRRLASILRAADQFDPLRYFELAETIEERDLHYVGVLGTRKRSVAQLDIQVDAASDDAAAVKQADMVREWISRDELQDELFDMLDAIGKGISLTEIIWDTSEGQWRPERLEWRDPRWFTFAREDGKTPLLRTDEGDKPLTGYKFIDARIKAKSGLPARSGLARIACWAWMFKAFAQRDWAIFTQTYGQPIRIGKYRPGATEEEKDTLFRAVANVAGDMAAIVPESMLIEFVESKSVSQSTALYKERSDWLDQQVSKAVLGQTATTDAIAGGHAVGREHRQVQEDIERADAKSMSAILNRDLVKPWVNLEAGPQKKYPRLRIGRKEERDAKMVLDAVKTFVPMGLKVQMSDVRDMLGLAEPDDDAELLTPPAAPIKMTDQNDDQNDSQVPELQASTTSTTCTPRLPRDPVELLAGMAETVAQPGTDAMIDTIRRMINEAKSLDEVRDNIVKLSPHMPEADLAVLMRLALVMAELSGRNEIGAVP